MFRHGADVNATGEECALRHHKNDYRCSVCGEERVGLIDAFAALPRATSDCRAFPPGGKLGFCANCSTVQKPSDAEWDREAASIYARYDIFRQAADGAEQRVFDQASGTSLRRSEVVLRRLAEAYPFAKFGKALDVGCGNGPTLRALSEMAPQLALFGHEISDANEKRLSAIPRFQRLFTGDPANIEGEYDLITLFHSLEHLPEPTEGLATLRTKLAPGGLLLVEVPNIRQNIYDLVVADHRSHFDPLALAESARRAGFAHFAVFDNWAFKELTLVASDAPLAITADLSALPPLTGETLIQRVDWLAAVVRAATEAASDSSRFGLFGTAIAATWLSEPLGDRVEFFVDEDPTRIGQTHEGRPIYAPDKIPSGATVFAPLVPKVAAAVAERLGKIGVDVRVPPPQEFTPW